jgi:hypothetical protein
LRHIKYDVVAIIRRDPLQAANRDGLLFETAAAARGLTRAIAGSTKHTGKNVGIPVDHIRFGIPAFGNKTNVFRHRRMSRACVLAINDFVKVFGIGNVGRFQFVCTRKNKKLKQLNDSSTWPVCKENNSHCGTFQGLTILRKFVIILFPPSGIS